MTDRIRNAFALVAAHRVLAGILALVGLGSGGYWMSGNANSAAVAAIEKANGDLVELDMPVESGVVLFNKNGKGGNLILNNYKYVKGQQPPAHGLSVQCWVTDTNDARAKLSAYKGKTVHVKGTKGTFRDRPQIRVANLSDISPK